MAVDEYRAKHKIDSEIKTIDPESIYWRAGPKQA
jgi:hypothetical protein